MSLATKNKDELKGIARALLIELPEEATKAEILAVFAEEEVKPEDYENIEIPPEPAENAVVANTADGIVTTETIKSEAAPAPKSSFPVESSTSASLADVPDGTTLLKCDRVNPTFQVGEYTFTREHPFQIVKTVDAEYIVRNIPGFRPAMPSEAQEFYS